MSKIICSFYYSQLSCKNGQDFLDIQYDPSKEKTLLTINVGQICPMMSEGGRRGRVGLAGVHGPALVMVLILDGSSEMVAHVRSNLSYLICLRNLIRSK